MGRSEHGVSIFLSAASGRLSTTGKGVQVLFQIACQYVCLPERRWLCQTGTIIELAHKCCFSRSMAQETKTEPGEQEALIAGTGACLAQCGVLAIMAVYAYDWWPTALTNTCKSQTLEQRVSVRKSVEKLVNLSWAAIFLLKVWEDIVASPSNKIAQWSGHAAVPGTMRESGAANFGHGVSWHHATCHHHPDHGCDD